MNQPLAEHFAQAYADLLRLARHRLAGERAPVSAATLAHELFLDMAGRAGLAFASRGEFLAYAGRAMRSLLVDLARERAAAKRKADWVTLSLAEHVADPVAGTPEQWLSLGQAFERLGLISERALQVAEMRVLLGLELSEVALALGVSEPTIKRDWQRAKAYLFEALGPPA